MLAPFILKDLVQQKGWDLMILFSLQNTRTKTGVKFCISKPQLTDASIESYVSDTIQY